MKKNHLDAFENNARYYEPSKNSFDRADSGEMTIMSSTQINKVYALIKLNNFDDYYLYAGRSMDGNVIGALNDTVSAKNEYNFLESSRNKISLIFILLYIIISLVSYELRNKFYFYQVRFAIHQLQNINYH